jgi:hypothetical protein
MHPKPRRRYSLAYEELRDLSPWDVRIDTGTVAQVVDLIQLHPALEGFFIEKLLKGLRVFPPDPRFFSDPEMSWGNPSIWITVTEQHLRIRLKAEYRRQECICWVVEVRAEPLA